MKPTTAMGWLTTIILGVIAFWFMFWSAFWLSTFSALGTVTQDVTQDTLSYSQPVTQDIPKVYTPDAYDLHYAKYDPSGYGDPPAMICSRYANRIMGKQGDRIYDDYVPKYQAAEQRCMDELSPGWDY